MPAALASSHSAPLVDLPEIEILRGVALPKMSPRRQHALLQLEVAARLRSWAARAGDVGTEWRFRLTAGGPKKTILIPDVAYVAVERMQGLSDREIEEPPFAPNIAVEIRSPGDRLRKIAAKAAAYLEAGSVLVLDIDPIRRRIVAYHAQGQTTYTTPGVFQHDAAPRLTIDLEEMFRVLKRP